MRFEVPQFIDIEDKVVGPLTWKQFVYLGGGGGIVVVLFLNAPLAIAAMIGLPIAILSAALAFHKINNRPFSIFLEACINYFSRSKLYLWQKEKEQIIMDSRRIEETSTEPATAPIHKGNISLLSRSINTDENPAS